MKLVLFGAGGETPAAALRALLQRHHVQAVVRPFTHSRWMAKTLLPLARLMKLRRDDPFEQEARRAGIPILFARSGNDPVLHKQLAKLDPELICIATFPWLLGESIFALPPNGSVNVHASLLPRHRGPNPYFWVYYHDDARTGVSVHRVTGSADAGAILMQSDFPVHRGMSIGEMHAQNARLGAALLADVADRMETKALQEAPQNAALVTYAPRVKTGSRMIPFPEWPAERVWHVMSGLLPHFHEPVVCNGQTLLYDRVTGYERAESQREPGSVVCHKDMFHVFCRDGYVIVGGRLAGRAPL
jgi:methionyl-tRNA formyltransferase